MKIEPKNTVIEIEDDDDFLSQVAAVEAHALANKRRRIAPSGNAAVSTPRKISIDNDSGSNDVYLAALKGDRSIIGQRTGSDPLRGRVARGGVQVVAAGNDVVSGGASSDGAGSCFKCGKSGHWARDCDSTAGGGGGGQYGNYGSDPSIPEKSCACGSGICLVLTANTERNRGRKFYRCPLREENGGCGFFEWCDNASGTNSVMSVNHTSNSLYPDLPCPCGAGLCLTLTAKTGKNIGQQFYRCPANQGSSCGFFKWCNEQTVSACFPSTPTSRVPYGSSDTNNNSYPARTGSSCFKCGKEGHWAKDCSIPSSNSPAELGGRTASSGTCYKCGKPGHWSRDCPSS
ncbi:hypothetical protein UlMin_014076 [Ulmus minor]